MCSTWLNLNCRGRRRALLNWFFLNKLYRWLYLAILFIFSVCRLQFWYNNSNSSNNNNLGFALQVEELNWWIWAGLVPILVGAGCLALGYCIGTRRPFCFFLRLTPKVVRDTNTNPSSHHGNKNNNSKEPFETDKLADILDDFKMVTHILSIWKMYFPFIILYLLLSFNLFFLNVGFGC